MSRGIFFCDISGTFDGMENREQELKRFVDNLTKIIEHNNIDCLLFSFVSSDSIEDIKFYLEELKPYLINSKIKIGSQFSDCVTIDEQGNITDNPTIGKMSQIFSSIKDDISAIFYADDVKLNTYIFEKMVNIKYSHLLFKTFNPHEESYQHGIHCLNQELDNYINQLLTETNINRKIG